MQQLNFNLRVLIKCPPSLHQIFFIPLGHVQVIWARGGTRPIQLHHVDDLRFDLPHLAVMVDLSVSIRPHVVHEGVEQDRHEGNQLRENQPDKAANNIFALISFLLEFFCAKSPLK